MEFFCRSTYKINWNISVLKISQRLSFLLVDAHQIYGYFDSITVCEMQLWMRICVNSHNLYIRSHTHTQLLFEKWMTHAKLGNHLINLASAWWIKFYCTQATNEVDSKIKSENKINICPSNQIYLHTFRFYLISIECLPRVSFRLHRSLKPISPNIDEVCRILWELPLKINTNFSFAISI